MKYVGNFVQNLEQSIKLNDRSFQKELFIDKLSELISEHPEQIAEALKESGVKLPKVINKKNLISLAVDNLYLNIKFKKELSILMSEYIEQEEQQFSNFVDAIATAIGQVANSIGVVSSSVSDRKQSEQQTKQEREETKQVIFGKIFGSETGKNVLPIVMVVSVLAIGTIIAVIALKSKA